MLAAPGADGTEHALASAGEDQNPMTSTRVLPASSRARKSRPRHESAQEREAESAESHLTLRLFGQMLGRIEAMRVASRPARDTSQRVGSGEGGRS